MKRIYQPICYLTIGALGAYFFFTETSLGLQHVTPQHMAKLAFADGSVYEGDVGTNKLLAGQGKLTWKNGGSYEGEFKDGLFHGNGKITYSDKSIYVGEFVDGLAQGNGKIVFKNGNTYEGSFQNSLLNGQGTLKYSNGDIYEGEFVDDNMQGHGKWIIKNDSVYVGGIKEGGIYHGEGHITYESGDKYIGSFQNGEYHGQGNYVTEDGRSYTGEFVSGQFSGKGTYSKKGYGSIVGEFQNWMAHGSAVRSDDNGNQWKGTFEDSQLHGEGEYTGIDGEYYKGTFEYGFYSGTGEQIDKEGNHYKGEFTSGQKHGEGEMTLKEPLNNISHYTGRWRYGVLEEGDDKFIIHSSDVIGEHALYNQIPLLDTALQKITIDDNQKTDLYMLGIAGWGKEEVFTREINFVNQMFSEHYDTEGRTIILGNSRRDINTRPLATITSIERSIQHLSKTMNKEQDILFLYATSHGSQKKGLSLGQKGISLPDLEPEKLKGFLDQSGIKNRVIIVSACYSGKFVEALKDDNTLIISSSAPDKTSFGCSDSRAFTYFGKAYFKESLPKSTNMVEAFHKASALVEQWEEEEGLTPSDPMIHAPKNIESKLNNWLQTLAKSENTAT